VERSIPTIIVDEERVCGCSCIWSNYDVDRVVLRAPLGCEIQLKIPLKISDSCEVATLHTRAVERSIPTIIVDEERVCGCSRIWSNYDVDLVMLRAPLVCEVQLEIPLKISDSCEVATLHTRAVERSIPTIIADGERVC
jgi:hypothetical protein